MTWISSAILGLLVTIFIAFLKRGANAWSTFSFLGLFGILGLYGFDLMQMPPDFRWRFIKSDDYEVLLILALGFVFCFGSGEYLGNRISIRNLHIQNAYPRTYEQLAIIVFLIGIIGQIIFIQSSGGFLTFYGASHGKSANFNSAYIYRLPHSMFTALTILFAFWIQNGRLSQIGKIVFVLGLLILFFDLFTQGRRGGVIKFAFMIIVPMIILGHLTRKRLIFLAGASVTTAGFLIILPYVRQALSLSNFKNLGEVLRELATVSDKFNQGYKVFMEGIHVTFASITVGGAIQAGDPNLGERWLYPFLNLIPRQFWPNKPTKFDIGTDFFDVSRSYSSIPIPDGSYPGGVAESFVEWSYFVFFVWFIMGLALGYIRGRAVQGKSMFSIVLLYSCLVFFTHFILQDTVQGINMFIYLFGPFLIIRLVFSILPRRARSQTRPNVNN